MPENSFKWKHYEGEIILLNVRWYLKYSLSYRTLEEMMAERGVEVDHTTIMRWVHQYSPEIEKKVRRYLKPTNDSWRMDETYIKVKGKYKYLYRAVDSNGNTIDFMLSAKRDRKTAKRFLKKALGSKHNQISRAITVDKNPAYPPAIKELKNDRILPQNVSLRQIKYLNNIVEQDHRSIKRIVRPMLGFQSFHTAIKTLKGIEIMHMIKKGQVDTLNRCVRAEVNFISYYSDSLERL
jgi:transposase-like protein